MKKVLVAAFAGVIVGAVGAYAILDRNLTTGGPQGRVAGKDIGNMPTMSGAVAAQHREDRYENLRTIEQILALPTDFSQTEALYVLAGRSDSGAVQNLITEANRIADPADRDGALVILFSRLTELDSPAALALARTAIFLADRGIESEVWRSWGKRDLDGALRAAKAHSTSGQRNLATQALFSVYGYLGNETTARIEHELGIRPDRTSRSRFLENLANQSPADAIEYISNIRLSRDQREALSWLAYYLNRNDPGRAGSYADMFTDAGQRETYRNFVATATIAADPTVVLDQLLTAYGPRPKNAQVLGAMRELVAQDVDSAIRYFERVNSRQDRQRFGSLIAVELARQDPARALDWARENEPGQSTRLLMRVLSKIASSDPRLAMDEANSIRHASRRNQAIAYVISTVARADPLLAAEFVDQITNRRDRQTAAANMVSLWARQDPDAAVNWAMTNDEIDSKAILTQVAMRLAQTDMDAMIRLLPRLDEENAVGWRRQIAQNLATRTSAAAAQNFINKFNGSEDYLKLRVAVVKGVIQNDIVLAKQLADQLPAGTDRDTTFVQLISYHANTNPIEAAAWLASISDRQQRSVATGQLVRVWNSQDSDAASRWVNNLPWGGQRDDAIVGLASNWQEMTQSRRFLIESIEDSDKKTQARIAYIGMVARTDWQKAQSMLTEIDLPSIYRQRIQTVIDHYRNQ